MVLFDVQQELRGSVLFSWEDQTSGHIAKWIQQYTEDQHWDPPMLQLRVNTNIVDQTMTYGAAGSSQPPSGALFASVTNLNSTSTAAETTTPSSAGSGRVRRHLQTTTASAGNGPPALRIKFEVEISYRTLNKNNINLVQVVLTAFESDQGRNEYAAGLKNSNENIYGQMDGYYLQVENSPNGPTGSSGGQDKTVVWTLVAAAVVAVAVSAFLFVLYLRRNDSRKQRTAKDIPSSGAVGTSAVFEPALNGVNPMRPGNRVSHLEQ